jgi:hypothetical protein
MHGHVMWCTSLIYIFDGYMLHYLPSMHGHIICYITYYRCIVISLNSTYYRCIVISLNSTYHRCMVMLYDTSPIIDALPCPGMHHLSSMHGHAFWYITCHRCMFISCDISPTVIHHLPSIHGHVIWYTTYHRCHMIHHLRLCHMIHLLSSMHGWYITYYRCVVMSCDTSPTIDKYDT